jgi:FkbM family methyltransferase
MLHLMKRALRRSLRSVGYAVVRIPEDKAPAVLRISAAREASAKPVAANVSQQSPAQVARPTRDRFAEIDALLSLVTPWSGRVPEGYIVDFLGILTKGSFLWNRTGPFDAYDVDTALPTLTTYGEGLFEVAEWFYSAREATDQYVVVSLGAAYGAQLVGAWKVLQAINPLPARLVAVEPVPENCEWIRQHMSANGINPDDHWILQTALGSDNEPMLFPVGAPGTGLTSGVETNSPEARKALASTLRIRDQSDVVLENILMYNATGLTHKLAHGYTADVKFVSAMTLRDVLGPFERIDLLEVDIQGSEVPVISPCMDLINRRVRRLHVGTHGQDIHKTLRGMFSAAGWEFVFDYSPGARHVTERGSLEISDGILGLRNPAV